MRCTNARKLRFYVIALCMTLFALPARAEIITGRIIDSETGMPLAGVSISAESKHDDAEGNSGFITISTKTKPSGQFRFQVWIGETTITFSFIGYRDLKYSRTTTNDTTRIDLGDIKMNMDDRLLSAVTIKGQRPKFYMRGDTVIYNPEAFDLKDGDRIEKLIKMLPGVTVDEVGNISWLGKPIKMEMNGRESIATSTFLPKVDAKAVENIQVYDKITDNWGDTVRAHKVMDVKIKKSWMERWYGEAGVSGQTDRYYGLLGTTYNLSDKVPMQVGASMSDGDGIYDVTRYSQERVRRDKTAIVRSHQLRVDVQKQPDIGAKNKYSISEQSSLNHSDTRRRSESNSEQYLSDGQVQYGVGRSTSYAHRMDIAPINLDYQLHKTYNYAHGTRAFVWDANMGMSFYRERTESSSAGANFSDNPFALGNRPLDDLLNADNALAGIALNSNMSKRYGTSDNFNVNGGGRIGFPIKSFDFGAELKLRFQSRKRHDELARVTNYYRQDTPSSLIDLQRSSNPSHSMHYQLNLDVRKTTKNMGQISFRYENSARNDYNKYDNYRLQQRDSLIENLAREFGSLDDVPTEAYERDLVNSKTKNQTDLDNLFGFSWMASLRPLKEKGMNIILQTSLRHSHQRMHYRRGAQIDTVAHRNLLLPSASLNIEKKINKKISTTFRSGFNKSATDFEQTMRYTDDTNPLYIVQGNPHLRNSSTWNNTLSTSLNLPKNQIMATLSASLIQAYNAHTQLLYRNPETGAYRAIYDNISGGHTWRVSGTLDMKLSHKTDLRYTPSYDFNKSYRYLTVNEDNPEFLLNTQRMHNLVNNLSLRWYNDICEMKFFANTSLRKYRNNEGAYARYTYFDYNIGVNSSVEICSAVKVGLDVSLDGKNGYLQSDMNKDRWLMDASVAVRMLRGKGTLTFAAIDILRQQTNRLYNVTASSRSETRTYGLTHYYMLSFSYMFGKPKGQ